MPKRKVFSGESLCDLLGDHDFITVPQRGSQRVMQKKDGSATITVPVPLHREVKPGTLASIIRQSQLDRTLFET
jgi:predicted RNA binding protein YcfA (HicA-like mRNA interferase family)